MFFKGLRPLPVALGPAPQGVLQEVLHRRRNTYLSRIIVPADLQRVLGRVEITRSLRTGDRREALRRQPLWEAQVRTYLSLVRQHHATMTRAQLDALTRQYLERTLEEIEEQLALEWDEAALEAHQDDFIDEARRLSAGLARADYAPLLTEAEAALPNAEEEQVRRLARRFMEAKLEALEAGVKAINGEPLRAASLERLVPSATANPPSLPDIAKSTSPALSTVVARYAESKRATKSWSPRSAEHYAEIYATVVELLGDAPIASVTKDDIRRLGLSLTNYPRNVHTRQEANEHEDCNCSANRRVPSGVLRGRTIEPADEVRYGVWRDRCGGRRSG